MRRNTALYSEIYLLYIGSFFLPVKIWICLHLLASDNISDQTMSGFEGKVTLVLTTYRHIQPMASALILSFNIHVSL